MDQTMMTYLVHAVGLKRWTLVKLLVWTTFRECGKMVPYMFRFHRLSFYVHCNDKWILLILGTQVIKTGAFCSTNGYSQIILTFWAIWREKFDDFMLGHTLCVYTKCEWILEYKSSEKNKAAMKVCAFAIIKDTLLLFGS